MDSEQEDLTFAEAADVIRIVLADRRAMFYGGTAVAEYAEGKVRRALKSALRALEQREAATPPRDVPEAPITASMLADAFSCFWNAAMNAGHDRQDYTALSTIGAMVEGFGAISNRLQEFAAAPRPDKENGDG